MDQRPSTNPLAAEFSHTDKDGMITCWCGDYSMWWGHHNDPRHSYNHRLDHLEGRYGEHGRENGTLAGSNRSA